MSHDNQEFYRTTPARTGKMMAIMLGICIVGGAIFFGMWDYWISEPAPVVAMMAGGDSGPAEVAVHTGATITSDLSFVESSDFITLAFNALPGEPDNNPTINMEVGDKVIFNVVNDGKSFHSFGVTADAEGLGGIIPGSEVASPSNPLKSGEGGTSEFVAGKEGVFYYICTVPGHREQGMVGRIIVGDVAVEEEVMEAVAPEPIKEVEPMEERTPVSTEPVAYDGPISIPEGSGVPGCQETNECYIPYHVTAPAGTEITWSNDDTVVHTVTSGSPQDGSDGTFDSGILAGGLEFSVTLDEAGQYPYYCIVHLWMIGNITIE